MAIGTSNSRVELVPLLITCLLLGSCNSIVQGLEAPGLILNPSFNAPELSLGERDPASLAQEQDWAEAWAKVKSRERQKSFNSSGLNVGLKNTISDVFGDLDGRTTFSNNSMPADQFLFLPDIEASAGFGVNIGYRWKRYEMLLSWQETEYDARFAGLAKDTTISYVDLLFREYFWINSRLQPFAVAGLGLSDANISGGAQDAALNLSTGELKAGINFNLGAGLSYYIFPGLSVFGQGMYRLGRYDTIGASFGEQSAPNAIDSDGWEISFGFSYSLQSPWD